MPVIKEYASYQSWLFIGRTDAEAEIPILWPPDEKGWLIRKDPDAGKDWRQEEKGMTEDEIVGWHDWLNGHELKQAPGDGEGQGGLVCCEVAKRWTWMNNSNNKLSLNNKLWNFLSFHIIIICKFVLHPLSLRILLPYFWIGSFMIAHDVHITPLLTSNDKTLNFTYQYFIIYYFWISKKALMQIKGFFFIKWILHSDQFSH